MKDGVFHGNPVYILIKNEINRPYPKVQARQTGKKIKNERYFYF
jgi:hypothetical protein